MSAAGRKPVYQVGKESIRSTLITIVRTCSARVQSAWVRRWWQAVMGSRQVPKREARAIRTVEPPSERLPPLTVRAMTSGRKLRSARLLSECRAGSRTNAKSSSKKRSMRWQRVAWGKVLPGCQPPWHTAVRRRSRSARADARHEVALGRCDLLHRQVALMHRLTPRGEGGILRLGETQVVDVAQQMDPAALVRAIVAVVRAGEVADQRPVVDLPEGVLDHGSCAAVGGVEVAQGRRAEGPDGPGCPYPPPSRLVGADGGARKAARAGVARSTTTLSRPTSVPTLKCNPCQVARSHGIARSGSRPTVRRLAMEAIVSRLTQWSPSTWSRKSSGGVQACAQHGQTRR